MTELQKRIMSVLTDEPKTAAEIADEIGVSAQSVAVALPWMRSRELADDGQGFAVIKGAVQVFEYPSESWHRLQGRVKWVAMPEAKREAIAKSRELLK